MDAVDKFNDFLYLVCQQVVLFHEAANIRYGFQNIEYRMKRDIILKQETSSNWSLFFLLCL